MKSNEIIDAKLKNPEWSPKDYSYGDWFKNKLIEIGFWFKDDQPPHFELQSSNFIIVVSPYPNVVVIFKNNRSFFNEIYCHSTIPQNEEEFEVFWNSIQSLI